MKSFTFNPFSTNCFIAVSDGEAAIVDPSCQSEEEIEVVERFVRDSGSDVKHILLTHGHLDHIFGCRALSDLFGVDISMHAADQPLLQHAERQAEMFAMPISAPPAPGAFLVEGDVVETGNLSWEVLHTPGHSPGSVSFVDREGGYVIAGDVLFAGSIGRTDLWQGSLPMLMQSIFQKIAPLPGEFVVYCGHGPATTVGREMAGNPFLTGPS